MDIHPPRGKTGASWKHTNTRSTEAPQIGVTVREPVEQGVDETTLIGGECLSPSNVSGENLEFLAEKVDTLGLQTTSKNRCCAAKKLARKARLGRAPSGNSGDG